ncbi:unnamed protein product [Camellia sinensis]
MKEEEKRSKGHTQSQSGMIYIEVDKFREELVKHPEKSLPSLLVTISGLFSKLEASIGHFHTVCQSDSSVDGSYSFPLMFEKLPKMNQEGSQWTDCEIRDAINLIYENLHKLDSYLNVICAANITWDSRASPEDMEEMWNHPIVSKEWSKSREKQGKVRFSHDAENRPYLSRVELKMVFCALAEIVSMRFVNGVGPRPRIMGIDYPTACWLYNHSVCENGDLNPSKGASIISCLTIKALWNLGYKAYIVESVDDLTKPFVSLYFGATYLAWLSQYEGSKERTPQFVVQAYLAGPKNVNLQETSPLWLKFEEALSRYEDLKDGSERIEDHGKQHGERFRMMGFERLSVLGKLEVLDLGNNFFNNSILQSLGVLSSLKTSSLRYTRLDGLIDLGASM